MNETCSSRRAIYIAAGIIVLATAIAYSNSVVAPFVFDDLPSTVNNPTIRQLWPIGSVLLPPGDYAAVQRRPVVNLSLAINYAISGDKPWSYHVFNVIAHMLSALVLFGIVRRTLLLPCRRDRFIQSAAPLAAAVALLWAVHPLLTDAVTYVIQRTEVLAGLFYLLALYCTLRGAFARHSRRWYAAAAAACILGVGCKETALTAPLIVLLYDRVFLSASWREAFQRRGGLYAIMALSWVFYLALLPYGVEGTSVFGENLAVVEYLLAQAGVIANYLKLCFWPDPLVFDYGLQLAQTTWQIVPFLALIAVLLLATFEAFRYRPWLGFLGLWFFVILAPSSSVIPLLQQPSAEKRMYLPLAAVVTCVVLGGFAAGQWLLRRGTLSARTLRFGGGVSVFVIVLVLVTLTIRRNVDYRSNLSIWQDTVAKMPKNSRAYYNLGLAYAARGRFDEAVGCFWKTIELTPSFAGAYNVLGNVYLYRGQTKKAVECYQTALRISPDFASAHNNMGNILLAQGRINEAIVHLYQALENKPECYTTYVNLGSALASRGQVDEAIVLFEKAVDLKPDSADAHNNLGRALASQGRLEEAVPHFQASLIIKPKYVSARDNLKRALTQIRANKQ